MCVVWCGVVLAGHGPSKAKTDAMAAAAKKRQRAKQEADEAFIKKAREDSRAWAEMSRLQVRR